MASSDAIPVPKKNTAFRVVFPIIDADGDLVTGATGLDSEVSKDQGTFADCTNEATEIATSSGVYYLDLTSTEMNADCVCVIVKTTSSGAKTTVLVFYPEESGDIRVNTTYLGGTLQTGRDIGASVLLSSGTGTGQVKLSSGYVAPNWGDVGNQTTSVNLTGTTILNATTTTTAASASAAYPILNAVTVGAGGSSTAIDISGAFPSFANDELNDLLLIIYDDSEAERHSRWIDDYTASTSLCTVAALPFTPESGADLVYIYPIRRDGQKLKATDGMGNQTANITGNLSGSVGSVTGAVGSVTGNVGGNVTGSVGSVVGAVGSVTGNVGGNVAGSVGSVTGGINTGSGVITTLDALDTAQDTQHGTTQTAIADVPTVAEFNARTLAAADYATSTALGAVDTVVDGIAAVLTGITSLAQWLGLIAGKQTGNTTARTELRATGAGSGTYDEVTDSLEAIKDAGSGGLDAAGVRAAIGLASANLDTQLADLPTVAEFEARTLVAANYFDPTTDAVATVTTLTNLPAITANWLTAAGLATDAVAEIQSGLATAANLATVAGYLDTEIAAILADTNELQTNQGNWLTATGFATPTNVTDAQTAIIAQVDANETKIDTLTTTVGAAGAGLTALATAAELAKVPKSDGSATWNATALASIQQEATDALYAAPPSNGAGVAPLSVSYFAMAAFNYTRTDSLLTVKSDDGTTQDTHTLTEDDTLGPVGTITGGA